MKLKTTIIFELRGNESPILSESLEDLATDIFSQGWDQVSDIKEIISVSCVPLDTSEEIVVEVKGGVAYCDDPRVKIIDYDNEE